MFSHFSFALIFVAIFICVALPERVVTDLSVIYGSHGVPVDYSFNETSYNTEEVLSSVPGCPKCIDGYPWILYGFPPRCFLTGQNGPCPQEQVLFPEPGSLHGLCACKCLINRHRKHPGVLEESKRFVMCELENSELYPYGQIWDKEARRCYPYYQQGPCPSGSVITGYNDTSLECEPSCIDDVNTYNSLRCAVGPISSHFIANFIPRSRDKCLDRNERYSNVLKTCVQRFVRRVLFLEQFIG